MPTLTRFGPDESVRLARDLGAPIETQEVDDA